MPLRLPRTKPPLSKGGGPPKVVGGFLPSEEVTKTMTREHLFDAITNVRDELIDEAGRAARARPRINWMKWGGVAAAAALVIGAAGWWAVNNVGGNSASPGAGAGGSGHDGGATVFTSYAGPVFPLTARSGGEGLTAQRRLTYDFSPWNKVWWSNEDEASSRTGLTEEERQEVLEFYNEYYPEGGTYRSSTDLLVTDSCTLTNPTGEDRTVKVLYPFVSSLWELDEDVPALSLDGEELETVLHAGGYSGGFQAVEGSNGTEHLLNLAQLNSWEQYKALLSDGRYLDAALDDFPDLSDTPVIVYRFSNCYGPEEDSRAGVPNPTIRAWFDLDYGQTTVLSYGFHGCRRDPEAGTMSQSFSIRQPGEPGHGQPYYLFVLGDDIQNLTTGGYVTGGNDPDTKPLDSGGWGVDVERYVTDLESALREAARLMYGERERMADPDRPARPDFELYFGLMKQFLLSYGALAEDGPERYGTGWLEELDFANVSRVFYLEAEVTVPAGGGVTVAAELTKSASYDFYCASTENRGIYGYDTVTRLGSTLTFTGQTAEAVNTDEVELVRQNYGFDWANGVTEVELDPDVEHYYLEVRRAAEPEA